MIAEENATKNRGHKGPGIPMTRIGYCTFRLTSSITNEVCRLVSSVPLKRI